jgi:hypothetical protein
MVVIYEGFKFFNHFSRSVDFCHAEDWPDELCQREKRPQWRVQCNSISLISVIEKPGLPYIILLVASRASVFADVPAGSSEESSSPPKNNALAAMIFTLVKDGLAGGYPSLI